MTLYRCLIQWLSTVAMEIMLQTRYGMRSDKHSVKYQPAADGVPEEQLTQPCRSL